MILPSTLPSVAIAISHQLPFSSCKRYRSNASDPPGNKVEDTRADANNAQSHSFSHCMCPFNGKQVIKQVFYVAVMWVTCVSDHTIASRYIREIHVISRVLPCSAHCWTFSQSPCSTALHMLSFLLISDDASVSPW